MGQDMNVWSSSLKGRVAIVTGAGSGLGRASVLGLLKAGATVVATDISQKGLDETKALARDIGFSPLVIKIMDVSVESEVKRVFQETESELGSLDILHSNAGVERYIALEEMEEVDLDLLLDVDLKGVLLTCKHAIPAMRRAGGGSIVITSSVQASHSLPGCVVYAAAKAGVIAAARTLALEVGNGNIRVNAISPGTINTPMLTRDLADMNVGKAEEFLDTVKSANALHRIGEASEIADAVVFLCSDKALYITGSNLVVDGGFTAVKSI
jgi:NAD(P)-dependent dehydrogenase (short-subunit alcohol dehydrogenase family)